MYSPYDDPNYRPTRAKRIGDRLRVLFVQRANLMRDLGAIELEIQELQHELSLEEDGEKRIG